MVKECQITDSSAGVGINRLYKAGDILSSYPVKFNYQELLYYLPNQSIISKLKEILPDHAKTMHRIYQALVEEDGFLFWSEFEKVSAGVVDISKSERETAEKIFDKMKMLKVVEPLYDFQGTQVVIANKDWYDNQIVNANKLYKRMHDLSYTQELLVDLLKWLERMNFAGWNSSYITDENSISKGYNGFYFDAFSYTFLWGLYRTNQKDDLYEPAREKAGSPIVIESILHRQAKRHDINGFITRVANINGPIKNKMNFKIIPICFVDSIEKDALELARARGIMIITLTEVFGTKVVEALRSIRNIDVTKIDPNELTEILKKISDTGQDSKIGSLKGYVFNFLVSSIFEKFGHKPLIGREYKDPDDESIKCECDIVVTDEEHIIICEVKGWKKSKKVKLGESPSEKDSVKRFFERSYNIVRKSTGKKVWPIFITSADFTEEALEYLDKRNNSKKSQTFLEDYNFPKKLYYNRKDLIKIFSNKEQYTEHRRILKEFFS